MTWNSPPNWPAPPEGWTPPPGWKPDPAWGPAPDGWQFGPGSVSDDKPWNKLKVGEKKAADPERLKKEQRKGFAVLAGIGLVVAGCVAVSGGSEEDAVTTSAPGASRSPQATAAATEAPAPTKTPAPANALDTSENRLACTTSRRDVGKKAQIFTDVGKGTALPADGADAAKDLQKDTSDAASYSSGAIRTSLLSLSDAYGRIRVGLVTGDIGALTRGVGEQNATLKVLGGLCTSIGK